MSKLYKALLKLLSVFKRQQMSLSIPDITDYPVIDNEKVVIDALIEALIEGTNNIRIILLQAASIDPSKNKNYSPKVCNVLTGMISRISKLYDNFIFLGSENRVEAGWILSRSLCEAVVQLIYILEDQNPGSIIEKFIKSSLAEDKRLYDFIRENIQDGEPNFFESRMMSSIEAEFKEEDIEIENVDPKNDAKWCPNMYELAEKVNLLSVYESFFRTSSRAVHGSWYHLKQYYIREDGQPEYEHHSYAPQIIIGTSSLVLEAVYYYSLKITNNVEFAKSLVNDAKLWISNIDKQFETHESKKD